MTTTAPEMSTTTATPKRREPRLKAPVVRRSEAGEDGRCTQCGASIGQPHAGNCVTANKTKLVKAKEPTPRPTVTELRRQKQRKARAKTARRIVRQYLRAATIANAVDQDEETRAYFAARCEAMEETLAGALETLGELGLLDKRGDEDEEDGDEA